MPESFYFTSEGPTYVKNTDYRPIGAPTLRGSRPHYTHYLTVRIAVAISEVKGTVARILSFAVISTVISIVISTNINNLIFSKCFAKFAIWQTICDG